MNAVRLPTHILLCIGRYLSFAPWIKYIYCFPEQIQYALIADIALPKLPIAKYFYRTTAVEEFRCIYNVMGSAETFLIGDFCVDSLRWFCAYETFVGKAPMLNCILPRYRKEILQRMASVGFLEGIQQLKLDDMTVGTIVHFGIHKTQSLDVIEYLLGICSRLK